MKRRFYAQAFDGLNTASAPHLIAHSEFQEAENVSYAELGAIGPLPLDVELWSTERQGVQGVYGVRYGGEDHVFAAVDAAILEDGVELSGMTAGTGTPSVVSDGDRAYILTGATAGGNYVYDGTFVRDHGSPAKPKTTSDAAAVVTVDGLIISSFTKHATAPVVTTLSDHNLESGDVVIMRDLLDATWSALNGNRYEITKTGTDTFTISEDTSGLGSFASGKVQPEGPELSMQYRYAAATVAVLPDGTEIESSLVVLWDHANGYENQNDPPTRNPTTLTGNEHAYIIVMLDGNPLTSYITPTTGVSYKVVVYRTKGNGDTFYVLREIASADLISDTAEFIDTTQDVDLGAAWLFDEDSNDTPPACTMGVICQQRLFLAGDFYHPRRLYYSGIARYDYFSPLDYIEVNDAITAIAEMGDRVAVFSDKGIGVYVPDETIGYFKMSLSPVGVEQQVSVKSTDVGVLFARNDGAWLFDGNSSVKINENLENIWTSGLWSVAYTPSRAVFTNQTIWFVADIAQGKWRWTQISGDAPEYISESADRSVLYGLFEAGAAPVKSLFTSVSNRVMRVRTRDWGGGGSWRGVEAVVDTAVTQHVTVRAHSTMGDVSEITFDDRGCRDRYRYALPRTVKGDYISVEVEGDAVVYGVELVVD